MKINGIELEEYFRHHPPQTEERRLKHDRVNAAMLEYCQSLLEWRDGATPRSDLEWYRSKVAYDIKDICQDGVCLGWAEDAMSKAYHACIAKQTEAVLMHVQQARMFLNQGIMIDELRNRNTPKMLKRVDTIFESQGSEETWEIQGVSYLRFADTVLNAISWERLDKGSWVDVPIEEWPALEKIREAATMTTGLT